MKYNVFGGMLNLALSIYLLCYVLLEMLISIWSFKVCFTLARLLCSTPVTFVVRKFWTCSVAAPAQQNSQVISRSEHLEPGHPDVLFTSKKFFLFFLVITLKTQRPPTPL